MSRHRFSHPMAVALVLVASGCLGASGNPGSGDTIVKDWDGALLEGFVVDNEFLPIPRALVRLADTSLETRTDDRGWFRFTGLNDRTYEITVEAAGWQGGQVSVSVAADRLTKITIFLDPELSAKPFSMLRTINGKLTCVLAEAGGQSTYTLTCNPIERSLGFPDGWAATVTEFTSGGSGFSTQARTKILMGYNETSGGSKQVYTYATREDAPPLRFVLRPEATYPGFGGSVMTPKAGVAGPLTIEVRKAPAKVVDVSVHGHLTIEESFTIHHTTFFHEAPDNLDTFSVLKP